MTRVTLTALPLLVALGLAACETVEGAGETVQNTGEFVEGEADEVQENMN